ncbi:MAG TPA: DUF5123 domain-containing protein [Hanamia sp.]|nr:DUF5123 domain-containing protein [Hanamia sp.]
MKKYKNLNFASTVAIVLVIVIGISCMKKPVRYFIPSQMFTPVSISVTTTDTSVTITWPPSINTETTGQKYTVQISADSTFTTPPALSLIVNLPKVTVTDDTLKDRTAYYVRLQTNATATSAASNWISNNPSSFKLIGEQLFKPLTSGNIVDNAVILNWIPTPGITQIVLTPGTGTVITVPISSATNAAGADTVYGLTANTSYTAILYQGNKTVGVLNFVTAASVSGSNIIDLRGNTDPNSLIDTLPMIPSGSVVLLQPGMIYDAPATYIFTQNVTIETGLGFGTPAIISIAANFDASGTIDSLNFKNLIFKANGSGYVMNVSNVVNITSINFTNCTTQGNFTNSFVRLKKARDVVTNLNITNCIIDSVGVTSKYAVIYANASSTAVFTNINVQNSTFYYIYDFITQTGVKTANALNVTNCTFNNFINQSGYFVNYSATFPPTVNFTNDIFGSTLDPTTANGIKSTSNAVFNGCYQTSDCVFFADPLVGPSSYAGTSYNLFTDPDNGNFSFKDATFSGKGTAGDPRWW